MFGKIVNLLGGDPNKRKINEFTGLVEEINALEAEFEALSDEALRAKTAEFRDRFSQGETLDDLLVEAFAAVREAAKRTLGQRAYDVQLIGGIALHRGIIAEMRTGEGKTLLATLPVYLNSLTGRGVHVVTVNDYLARRDARWMGAIYRALGLEVGILQMASRTENGRMAFLYDPERRSPHEDQDQLRMEHRREAYKADVTYGTNSEFGFDYLRDNLTMSLADRVQRGHYFAIVDEVDNILIDEARTPLIISGPASEDTEWYQRMAQVVRQLNPEDYDIDEKERAISLTEIGEAHVEQILDLPLADPERPEDITPEQARMLGYLEQSMRAQFLFRRNKDYLVQGGKVVIVDEFTGRLMPGRRWSDGLHQAVEAKEGVKVEPENVTYATITLQNYFRMYEKLAGMTGTALTESEEFYKIYKLDVLPIPTNLEYQSSRSTAPLVEVEAKDEQGYRYNYFARRDDPRKEALYYRRKDFPDVVFRTEEAKLRAITREIVYYHIKGRPQLVGTTSVEHSERLSDRLHPEPLRRQFQVMLIRQAWLDTNNRQESERAIPELQPLYAPLETLQAGELRQMARANGMGSINPEDEANLPRLMSLLELDAADKPRLVSVLQAGVPHQVLNARKHDEESQIIAGAGAFGAVTIATNMAGRGVDIKLGGELPEEVIAGVNHILAKTGTKDPYDLNMDQRLAALRNVAPEDYGVYETDALAFLQYIDDMRRVRELGGLHVIGSERHEARRIDNQLRGRAARQGDPGSSRFYLSLGDELMRLFGGGQVENLMTRLNIDEALPIESGMVGKLVEQSQHRVEGSNFDVRKHLLEYDDVLNTQRNRIYSQRDRVFTKEDLHDDVTEMLRTELARRIPESLKDEEGPWKLLAYLEEIQPPLDFPGVVYPSYTMRLLLQEVEGAATAPALREKILNLAERALKAENEHLLKAARDLLERTEETLETQLQERFDALDTYIEAHESGEADEDEETGEPRGPRRPQDAQEELSNLVRVPLRLSNEQLRQLVNDPRQIYEDVRAQVEGSVMALTTTRLVATFERRLEENLNLKAGQFAGKSWSETASALLLAVEDALLGRENRFLGETGPIARDLDADPARLQAAVDSPEERVRLLGAISQGARLAFDAKTHRRSMQATTRLRYPYLAARLLEDQQPQEVTTDVLEHLEEAQEQMGRVWGQTEFNRLAQAELPVKALDEPMQADLRERLGPEYVEQLQEMTLPALDDVDRQAVTAALGRRMQTEIYRQLLLSVISELWVDYLTKVEALRVSIGLEAYAQRDPLVMYKGKASEMFTQLLSDIRTAVISRMFIYRPRIAPPPTQQTDGQAGEDAGDGADSEQAEGAAQAVQAAGSTAAGPAGAAGKPAAQTATASGKKKRKRH